MKIVPFLRDRSLKHLWKTDLKGYQSLEVDLNKRVIFVLSSRFPKNIHVMKPLTTFRFLLSWRSVGSLSSPSLRCFIDCSSAWILPLASQGLLGRACTSNSDQINVNKRRIRAHLPTKSKRVKYAGGIWVADKVICLWLDLLEEWNSGGDSLSRPRCANNNSCTDWPPVQLEGRGGR